MKAKNLKTGKTEGPALSVLDALALAGHSVIRPASKESGVLVNAQDYDPRTPDERVKIMSPRTIVLQDKTPTGKPMKKPRTLTVRQVAVWPSNRNSKARPNQEIGLTECRETGEVFYLWSHITKQNGAFMPKVYDLAPEPLIEAFEQAAARSSSMDSLTPEDRAALGFVG